MSKEIEYLLSAILGCMVGSVIGVGLVIYIFHKWSDQIMDYFDKKFDKFL